jgi:hypothetical protein
LEELLGKLNEKEDILNTYINGEDNTLELYSTFDHSSTKMKIHLNCRILDISQEYGDKEYTIIIQDFSK